MRLRSMLAAASLVAITVVPASSTLAQTLPVDRPAELRNGTCASPGEVVAPLANLVLTEGEVQGQSGATPVEQSGTVIPLTVASVLTADHAIVVRRAQEDATVVACGEVGGAINPDGTLAIGMNPVNGSGLAGIAYFTPIDSYDKVLVTILLVDQGGDTSTEAVAVDSELAASNESVPSAQSNVSAVEPATISLSE